MLRKSFSLIVLVLLVFIFSSTMDVDASNKSYKNGWNIEKTDVTQDYIFSHSSLMFVDSEFVIQYADYSKSSDVVEEAVNDWNSLGLVSINETKKDVSLFVIEENLGPNEIISSYIVDDGFRYIVLNNYYFEDLTYEEKIYVVSHELGHALGLIDLPSEDSMNSIMFDTFNLNSNQISILDILLLSELLTREDKSFDS
jgi:predicted Zn-dependent protease